jgi:hypothetical protein
LYPLLRIQLLELAAIFFDAQRQVLNLAVIPVEAAAQVRPDIVDCRVFGEQREELF